MSPKADRTELNKRIAIEVMGEAEPPPRKRLFFASRDEPDTEAHSRAWIRSYTAGKASVCPKDFAGNMKLAMKAVDEVLDGTLDLLNLRYKRTGWVATLMRDVGYGAHAGVVEVSGGTAPEAICRCLLAYKEAMA